MMMMMDDDDARFDIVWNRRWVAFIGDSLFVGLSVTKDSTKGRERDP
jgi:hypothetical protein